ncbi:mucin-4-like [Echeneis naucrates]|uniref:mucin-4-like n=1 Tax=Echeneis naucrates TaxID=173247 RepID=UPI001113DD58|nr:mucin-4-like [Echeneis naucrates]
MASETSVQASCIQENPDIDECRENIPPGVTDEVGTSKLKVQVGDVMGYSSAQPSGEIELLSDTCAFSTPAPESSNGGFKSKSRLSGFKSALTPILKYLKISNKSPSPEPLNSTGGCGQNPKSDFSTGHYGRSLGDKDPSVFWLHDEYLPEITLLDVTRDSTMQITRNDSLLPDSMPATPVKSCSVNGTFSTSQPPQLNCSTNINISADKHPENKTVDPLQSRGSSPEAETKTTDQAHQVSKITPEKSLITNVSISADKSGNLRDKEDTSVPNCTDNTLTKMVDIPASLHAPECWLDDRYFPEITLLDVTRGSEVSPSAERCSVDVTQDDLPVDSGKNQMPSSELSGQTVAQPGKVEMIQSDELSSIGNATHSLSSFNEQSKYMEENIVKVSLEGTRDISESSILEDSQPSSEPSGQKKVTSPTPADDTFQRNPANVTRDISSSTDMSVQGIESQCNTSLKNVTSELNGEPSETSNTVKTSHNVSLTDNVSPPSPKTANSANGIFTFAESSNLNASSNLSAVAQISCPQNRTLELPSNEDIHKADSKGTDQISAECENAPETCLVMKQDSLAAETSGLSEVHYATFDSHSLQKAQGTTHLGEASAASLCLQNNTFESKPPAIQNGTISLSETSSSISHQNTFDNPSPAEVCNQTMSPKGSPIEAPSSELPTQQISTDPNPKTAVTPESTSEANSTEDVVSGAGTDEFKSHTNSTLPATDALSVLGHQNMDFGNNKANAFNLDETLDLKVDCLVTSTPMTNCKALPFSIDPENAKIIGAQKKLCMYGPTKRADQGLSDVPSNIVSDRKTFLTQPAAKSLLPPMKAASQPLKYKPASTFPGRCEPLTSGVPMTRQRAQAEALKNLAASDAAQGTTATSSSYNLRTTTGSRQPNSGLLRPQLSGIPPGIQRTVTGLRMPCARSNAPPTSTTEKLRGPTVMNPATKASQAKKHPLTKSEALPIAKKKKMDNPLPASISVASTSSSDTVNKAKTLKQPRTLRALPAKTQRDDAVVPVSTAEPSTSCVASSSARAMKQPGKLLSKPQIHGCAKCVTLQEQLDIKSEEIMRLRAELLKYS